MAALTADRARELMAYDPETGVFSWNGVRRRGYRPADIPGHLDKPTGYLDIGIDRVKYRSHRLAWLIVTGDWPKGVIDHIDGNRINNIFSNLRDVSQSDNCKNRAMNINNKSGFIGVYWRKREGRWCASITIARKEKYLGMFKTIEEAARVREKASAEVFGEFNR